MGLKFELEMGAAKWIYAPSRILLLVHDILPDKVCFELFLKENYCVRSATQKELSAFFIRKKMKSAELPIALEEPIQKD